MMAGLSPLLRLTRIRGEAVHLTAVGLFLGISYGAGLLIRKARSGAVSPLQVFPFCVFMGFAHSVIEDTLVVMALVVMALGASAWGILAGRVTFAVAAPLRHVQNATFFGFYFQTAHHQPAAAGMNTNKMAA